MLVNRDTVSPLEWAVSAVSESGNWLYILVVAQNPRFKTMFTLSRVFARPVQPLLGPYKACRHWLVPQKWLHKGFNIAFLLAVYPCSKER